MVPTRRMVLKSKTLQPSVFSPSASALCPRLFVLGPSALQPRSSALGLAFRASATQSFGLRLHLPPSPFGRCRTTSLLRHFGVVSKPKYVLASDFGVVPKPNYVLASALRRRSEAELRPCLGTSASFRSRTTSSLRHLPKSFHIYGFGTRHPVEAIPCLRVRHSASRRDRSMSSGSASPVPPRYYPSAAAL